MDKSNRRQYERSVQQTSDGGFIVAGRIAGDIWLIRMNSYGDTLWTKTYGEDGFYDDAVSVQQTSDGGFIIAGQTESFSADSTDAYIFKTDFSGDSVWMKIFGGSGIDRATNVIQTSDGGYIVVGNTGSFGVGGYDAFIRRYNSAGNFVWSKIYGGLNSDFFDNVKQTFSGGYVITGRTMETGVEDLWLLCTDLSGDTLWKKIYGGPSPEVGKEVFQTADSGYIVAGNTYSSGGSDIWIIRTDTSGDTLWTKTYGSTSTDYCRSLDQTPDGGLIISGYTSSFGAGGIDAYFLRLNASGDTLWTKMLGSTESEDAQSVVATSEGGYIAAGYTTAFGSNDAWIIRLDSVSAVPVELVSFTAPGEFSLSQNYPNPFNPSTKISWQSPVSGWHTLKIYDVLGNEVVTLVDEYRPAGSYEIEFNTQQTTYNKQLTSGVYFYKLTAGNFTETKKLILLK